jgi:hypothetical protein
MVHKRADNRVLLRLAVFAAALAAGLIAGAAPPRAAVARDVFGVSGVAVDVTAASAAAARESALLDGQRKAALVLMHRLVLREDYPRIPALTDAQVLDLVQGIEVQEEKTSAVRYLGKLHVRFAPDKVRRFLRGAGLGYAETPSKPVVVTPVYRTDAGLSLWEETNPWFAAWARHDPPDGLVPLVVPLGDLGDIAGITADEAVQGNTEKLTAIARRYGAAEALVAVASPAPPQAPGASLNVDVAVSRFGGSQGEQTRILRVAGQTAEAPDALFARAVDEVVSQIEDDWKRENLLRFDREETLTATVPITDLRDWVELRRRLGEVVFVRRADVLSLSKARAVVAVHYIGDPGQLKTALAQKDVVLSEDTGAAPLPPTSATTPSASLPSSPLSPPAAPTAWILRLAAGGQAAATPPAAAAPSAASPAGDTAPASTPAPAEVEAPAPSAMPPSPAPGAPAPPEGTTSPGPAPVRADGNPAAPADAATPVPAPVPSAPPAGSATAPAAPPAMPVDGTPGQ